MKKQNGKNKLAFTKAAVIELNDQKLTEVNGGTSGDLISLIIVTRGYGTWLMVV